MPHLRDDYNTGSPSAGAVEGKTVLAIFTMNDGSTLEMLGSISSMDSGSLQVSFLTLASGTCNNALTGFAVDDLDQAVGTCAQQGVDRIATTQ